MDVPHRRFGSAGTSSRSSRDHKRERSHLNYSSLEAHSVLEHTVERTSGGESVCSDPERNIIARVEDDNPANWDYDICKEPL